MLSNLLKKIFGSHNQRLLKRMQATVGQINALEEQYAALSDQQLKAHTSLFRERLEQGASLDSLLPEAFATVREASKRTLGLRHFDVQMMVVWHCIKEKLQKCIRVKVKR